MQKKTLDNIIGKIELLQDGENNTFIIQGFTGSKDWYLVGWSKEEEIRQGKPEKCFFESCVCICKGERRDILGGNKFNGNACQNEGFCEFFDDRDVSVFSYYNALTHALGYDEGINTGATVSCIELGSNLIDVFVSKNQDKVEISYTDEKKTGFDPSICKLLSSEGYILS